MKVLVALVVILACCSAKPNWPYSPYTSPGLASVYHTPVEANCRIEYEFIKVNSCVPAFDIVCQKEARPSQTIGLKKVCKEIVDVVCGNHHQPSGEGHPVHAVPVQEGSEHTHGVEENIVLHESTPVAVVADALIPSVGSYIHPYHFQAHARHHCYEVPREYCYDVPLVRDVPLKVNVCHAKTIAKCRVITHRLSKHVCNQDTDGQLVADEVVSIEEVPVEENATDFKLFSPVGSLAPYY
jgi:hypothetical protein